MINMHAFPLFPSCDWYIRSGRINPFRKFTLEWNRANLQKEGGVSSIRFSFIARLQVRERTLLELDS